MKKMYILSLAFIGACSVEATSITPIDEPETEQVSLAASDKAESPSCSSPKTCDTDGIPQTCKNGHWSKGTPCPFACLGGDCVACKPGSSKHANNGKKKQVCDATGQWQDVEEAAKAPSCGTCANGLDCCSSIQVPGGSFLMGRGNATDSCPKGYKCDIDEAPEHNATVNSFSLDTFEVTVGRYRKFVEAYDGTPPATNAGEHPSVPGSGWQAAWNAKLPVSQTALKTPLHCDLGTWTDTPENNENAAISCVTFHEAFAFCIWEGQRLPTEAEWEYVAAGGAENRRYPWGAEQPTAATANCKDTTYSPTVEVGSFPAGVGKWGHYNLAGGMWEFVRDTFDTLKWYKGAGNNCNNCINLGTGIGPGVKGGGWTNSCATKVRSAERGDASRRYPEVGFRCAKSL